MSNSACAGGVGGDKRSQSSVIGVVLLFGIVIAGTGVIVLAGSTALTDTQQQSNVERASHEMTLFDSRAAMVALGDAESQTVSLSGAGGSFESNADAGYLRIAHRNYTDDATVRTEVIFNKTLGSVIYDGANSELAYQGGGVWRRDDGGGSTMISPPEFHYRDATLTLPIIRVANADAGSGSVQAIVRAKSRAERIFPNTTAPNDGVDEIGAPYNDTEADYVNPIRNGTVNITVHSRYYLGWAEYFNQRTEGDITIFESNNTVRLTLATVGGSIGDFDMPLEGNALNIRGMASGHPLDAYRMTLYPSNAKGKDYNNMHWSFYTDNGNERFEVHFYAPGQCNGNPESYGDVIDMSIYYYNNTDGTEIHEEWQNTSIDPATNPALDLDCTASGKPLEVDLLSDDIKLAYGDISITGNSNKWKLGPGIDADAATSTTSFGIHSADTGPHSDGDKKSLKYLMNHYLGLLSPTYDLTVTDGPGSSSRIDEGKSFGTLEYEVTTGSQYLTFLHITENKISVDIG